MNWTIFSIAVIVVFAGFCCFLVDSASCFDEERAHRFYEKCIGEEMQECSTKVRLQLSRSENLKTYAKTKLGKAAFLAAHKDELIRDMLGQHLSLRQHRVEAYLNKRFAQENGHLLKGLTASDAEE